MTLYESGYLAGWQLRATNERAPIRPADYDQVAVMTVPETAARYDVGEYEGWHDADCEIRVAELGAQAS